MRGLLCPRLNYEDRFNRFRQQKESCYESGHIFFHGNLLEHAKDKAIWDVECLKWQVFNKVMWWRTVPFHLNCQHNDIIYKRKVNLTCFIGKTNYHTPWETRLENLKGHDFIFCVQKSRPSAASILGMDVILAL